MAVKNNLEHQDDSPMLTSIITCKRNDTIKDIILSLDAKEKQRIYVVNEEENLEGVITLRDIISRLVHEPHGYFGDFFDGVFPLPKNTMV
jgi:CBS domain-containing protein